GHGRHYWSSDRRSVVRQVSQLSGGVLCCGRAGSSGALVRVVGQAATRGRFLIGLFGCGVRRNRSIKNRPQVENLPHKRSILSASAPSGRSKEEVPCRRSNCLSC